MNVYGTQPVEAKSYSPLFFPQVFGFMTLGLALTAIIGFFVMAIFTSVPNLRTTLVILLPIVIILELVIVIALSLFWQKFSAMISLGLFVLYSLMNGLLIGIIMSQYQLGSIAVAFLSTAGIFALFAGYGYLTKSDLTGWYKLALFGLGGIIIASLINIVVSFISPGVADGIYWLTTYAGVVIFVILIAADMQKLKRLAANAQEGDLLKYSIQGSLILYLDFINLFIRVLAIIGKRRN